MVHKTKLAVTALLTALVLLTSVTNSFGLAQDKKGTGKTPDGFPQKGIANLIMGVESDNAGLKKSSIFFAGAYELKEMVQPLVNQLAKEKDADTKILISLALYKIGDEEGIKAIQQFMANESNDIVKLMAKSIMKQLTEDNNPKYSVTEK